MGTAQMHFELRYQSLTDGRTSYSFRCDEAGFVEMDLLSARERTTYLFARGSVGYALAAPTVCAIRLG